MPPLTEKGDIRSVIQSIMFKEHLTIRTQCMETVSELQCFMIFGFFYNYLGQVTQIEITQIVKYF